MAQNLNSELLVKSIILMILFLPNYLDAEKKNIIPGNV